MILYFIGFAPLKNPNKKWHQRNSKSDHVFLKPLELVYKKNLKEFRDEV
jgi:hypothetical protein